MKRQAKVNEIKKSEEGEEEVMKRQKGLTRREMLKLSAAVGAGSLLVACAPVVTSTVASTVASTLVPPTVAPTAVPPTVAPSIVPPTSAPGVAPAAQAAVYEVYPPYGHPTMVVLPPVNRPDTLDGKTVCGLMGGAFHFDETWPVMVEVLKKKYPTATFIGSKDMKPTSTITVLNPTTGGIPSGWDAKEPEFVANLVKQYKCDAVISGNGC